MVDEPEGSGSAQRPPNPSPEDEALAKLGPQLRIDYLGRDPEHDEEVSALLAVDAFAAEDRAALEALGVTVGTVAGDVVTATFPLSRALEVAALPFVRKVEGARPMSPEEGGREDEPELP